MRRNKLFSTVLIAIITLTLFIAFVGLQVQAAKPQHPLLKGAYRIDKEDWIYVHLEGDPFQIGYQHGYLLADNINISWSAAIHVYWSENEFGDQWYIARDIARIYIWQKLPAEQKVEIEGIAAGVKAAGYNWDKWDITAFNAWADIDAYWDAYFEGVHPSGHIPLHHLEKGCSAFIATGDATADGQIVIGHNTWAGYAGDGYWNVIFDIKPNKGHRMIYQSTGGCIWSGQDWIYNDAGLMVCETTGVPSELEGYDIKGIPLFARERYAMQYTDNIDDWIAVMTYKGNGAYANEWLIGDAKTGEICRLQLGLKWNITRTFNGFFGSCNQAKWRTIRWEQLRQQYYGKITVEIGKIMLSDHFDTSKNVTAPSRNTICGHGEEVGRPSGAYDGKVTSSSLVMKEMGMWGRWGHPCGILFNATDFLAKYPQYAWQLPYLHNIPSKPVNWAYFTKDMKP
jgi:hypothetical protein